MRIYLLRHAQSQWQLEPSENLDTPLSELGWRQARLTAKWLSTGPALDESTGLRFGSLWSSPFRRAVQTAACIAEAAGIDPVERWQLGEAPFHVASHLPSRTRPEDPAEDWTPSGRYVEFRTQAHQALTLMVDEVRRTGLPVLAVTHGGLVKTLLRSTMGTDDYCFRLYNATLTALEWRRGRWHLVHLNLWDHLPPSLRTQ